MAIVEGKYGLLIDTTMCVGCEMCIRECQEANQLPGAEEDVPVKLGSESFTILEDHDGIIRRKFCFHCKDPACASACPVTAMQKTSDGPVIYDAKRCIGCRYCMVSCPHSIPKYEWDKNVPRVRKCIMCYKRVAEGKPTACAEACMFGATTFGTFEDMLAEALTRIKDNPEGYYPAIYGKTEAGGTQVMYLASVPFATLGFNVDLDDDPLPSLTENVLNSFPNVLSVGGVALLGTYWIINRRMTIEQEKALEAAIDAKNKEEVSR